MLEDTDRTAILTAIYDLISKVSKLEADLGHPRDSEIAALRHELKSRYAQLTQHDAEIR